jgi:hypothetical protein
MSQAKHEANQRWDLKNKDKVNASKLAYYHANKEVLKVKNKERYHRKKAEIVELKRLNATRQQAHDDLLEIYKTKGMPDWVVDAICVDMSKLYGLIDPRKLGELPRLLPKNPMIEVNSPIPDAI